MSFKEFWEQVDAKIAATDSTLLSRSELTLTDFGTIMSAVQAVTEESRTAMLLMELEP